MDIIKLLEEFEAIINLVDDKVATLDNNITTGLAEMPEVLVKIEKVLPDWFFFIEQTEIGSKEMVLNILNDITDAMQVSDGVLLSDALHYGLQGLLMDYCEIIKEALDEE